MLSDSKKIRLAGLVYLIVLVLGLIGQYLTSDSNFVVNNSLETAKNVENNLQLFKIGFVSNLISQSLYFILALVLYSFFKKISKTVSMLFLLMVSINVAMMNVNIFNQLGISIISSNSNILSSFSTEQLHEVIYFLFQMHKYGYTIAQLYFALWLIPLGYLIIKSHYFPKLWGFLLIMAGIFYGIDFLVAFLFPSFSELSIILTGIAFISEFLFCLWLLIVGAYKSKIKHTSYKHSTKSSSLLS